MRKAWLAPLLLAVALVLQLTVLNGLHLPRGGMPDLVLLLVVALAMADGPVRGMVTGFAAGLCLDIAPPDTGLIGQYALVFCLAGWAAGSLGRVTRRSPLRALAATAVVIAAAEAITAALGLLLEPAQVTVAEIRQFLPVTVAYDLLICPFVLYLVVLTGTVQASTGLAGTGLAGTGLLGGPARSKRPARQRRPHEPRLDPAAARAGDGWVGGGPASRPGLMPRARRVARPHPGAGVPGSASGYAHHRGLPGRPVNLRLSAGHRGDGAIGGAAGRHPGLLAGTSQSKYGKFRYGGELGGSAARQHAPAGLGPSRLRINFGAHRGDGSIASRVGPSRPARPGQGRRVAALRLRRGTSRSALALSSRVRPARSVPTLRFSTVAPPVARRPAATPKFRHTASPQVARRRAAVPKFRRTASAPVARRRAAVPKFRRTASPAAAAIRTAAVPKFRRRSGPLRPSALTPGLVVGGVLDQSTFRARRIAVGPPRLRLAGSRLGMLGGSGGSALRRPPARIRKVPQFGYGRRSLLSFLTGRRLGGRWLAKKRTGHRSGVWLISRRAGGAR